MRKALIISGRQGSGKTKIAENTSVLFDKPLFISGKLIKTYEQLYLISDINIFQK